MNEKNLEQYEWMADTKEHVYFMHFADMRKAEFNFSGGHIHKSTEIVVLYGGCLQCTVNSTTRQIHAGEILIINRYDSHQYEFVENASCYILVVADDYLDNVLEDGKSFNNFLHPSKRQFDQILSLLRRIDREFCNMNNLQKRGAVISFFGILMDDNLLKDARTHREEQIFVEINKYVSAHYKDKISLNAVARHIGYNKNYLSTLFNKTMEMTFSEYVNRYRLGRVMYEAQRNKGKTSMRWIVQECGFGSMETYYRTLHRYKVLQERKMAQEQKQKKKIWAVVVGYGNRGQVYADFSLTNPDELGIAAVVDVNPFRLEEARKAYNLSDEQLFTSFQDFLKGGIECNFVINATMDQDHYKTAMEILDAGYDMLLEKPIVPNAQQLNDIYRKAEEKKRKVFICHVLRYTPFYREIKQLINNGSIGDIISMEMNEHVENPHYITSYLRGKWNSEEKCGSGLLLAKCCHDLDLICWLNNTTQPIQIYSTGARAEYIKANQPKSATKFCYECPYERTCIHSAIRQYIDWDVMPFLVYDRLNKPLDEITIDEKMDFLRNDIYGMCVYDIEGADLVDRQQVNIRFENASMCNFTLSAGSARAERYIHIVGTKGEVEGKLSEHKFVLRQFTLEHVGYEEQVVDVSDKVVLKAKFGGHFGGDYNIMHDLIAYFNGDRSSISLSPIGDSVNGHLCVYAAEESRKEGKIVNLQ